MLDDERLTREYINNYLRFPRDVRFTQQPITKVTQLLGLRTSQVSLTEDCRKLRLNWDASFKDIPIDSVTKVEWATVESDASVPTRYLSVAVKGERTPYAIAGETEVMEILMSVIESASKSLAMTDTVSVIKYMFMHAVQYATEPPIERIELPPNPDSYPAV